MIGTPPFSFLLFLSIHPLEGCFSLLASKDAVCTLIYVGISTIPDGPVAECDGVLLIKRAYHSLVGTAEVGKGVVVRKDGILVHRDGTVGHVH